MKTFLSLNAIKPGRLLLAALPVLYLEGLQALLGNPFAPVTLIAAILFTLGVLGLAAWPGYQPAEKGFGKYSLAWPVLGLICLAGIAAAAVSPLLAWIGLAAFLALSLGVQDAAGGRSFSIRWWVSAILTGGLASLLVVFFNQVLTRFSEEEFFAAVQAVFLFGYWLCLAIGHTALRSQFHAGRWLKVRNIYPAAAGLVALVLGIFGIVRSYQASFYTADVSPYAGISAETPFLCGNAASPAPAEDTASFYQDYLQTVAANPKLAAPDEGLLFVATGDPKWASAFHDALLAEAAQNLYTGPANSVKFDQYLAALRVYAYGQVRAVKPDLFTPAEQARLEAWFHAINRRALTVEWVDWLYGVAFSYVPKGPYENQENGAGLIALLQAERLADPALAQQNQDYLANNLRGWAMRFHNTDDSLNYQGEWITNAYFQQIATGKALPQNVKNSFELALLQMLPDGRAPQYNIPNAYSMTNTLFLGGELLKDNHYLWLANKALSTAKAEAIPLVSQPGVDGSINPGPAAAPSQGSCLLYSDSGLPTQLGPLAPDKIVFRDGWSDDATYLLLNLRFTGWHRYKGTNTVTLLDKGGPLVSEAISGQSFSWLPVGRALFRDKRIPRQNLNGLQVPRRGLDAVLNELLGYGSPWAQDPPFYARVDQFSTGPEMDVSQTSLVDWNGWTQTRKIYFAHNGITVILDDAQGPATQSSAISWTIMGDRQTVPGRFILASKAASAEMVLLPQQDGAIQFTPDDDPATPGASQIMYKSPTSGHLRLVTLLLTGDWVGAQANITGSGSSQRLVIVQQAKTFELDLNISGR